MKILVQRHARDFTIYRALAIAQAFAGDGREVFLECLEEARRVLVLTPGVKWKNPHHALEVSERRMKDENEKEVIRKAGLRYDLVVNLDGDGPFEFRWSKLGLSFWTWAKGEARKAALAAKIEVPFIADWPEITEPACDPIGHCVLAAVLSEECLPSQVNVEELARFIGEKYPGKKVLFSAFEAFDFGAGREVLVAKDYAELAAQLRGVHAVFAVNGMAGALARSLLPDGRGPLVRRFWHVRGAPEDRPKIRGEVHGKPSGLEISPRPDPFAGIRFALEAPPNMAQGGIVAFSADFKLEEKQACPAD